MLLITWTDYRPQAALSFTPDRYVLDLAAQQEDVQIGQVQDTAPNLSQSMSNHVFALATKGIHSHRRDFDAVQRQ